jgi:hypothetical protein
MLKTKKRWPELTNISKEQELIRYDIQKLDELIDEFEQALLIPDLWEAHLIKKEIDAALKDLNDQA